MMNQPINSEEVECKNCGRFIAQAKMRMHEVQCLKLNKKCPLCNKCVLKSEYEQHVADKCQDKQIVEPPSAIVENAQINPLIPVLPKVNYALPGTISNPSALQQQPKIQEEFKYEQDEEDLDADAVNEKLIAQLMQDDLVEQEFGNKPKNQLQENDDVIDGVRKADSQKQVQLIGGDSDEEFSSSQQILDEQNFRNPTLHRPNAGTRPQVGLPRPGQQHGNIDQMDEDDEFLKALEASKQALQKGSAYLSYQEQNLGNKDDYVSSEYDDQLQKAMLESMGLTGKNESEPMDVDEDTELAKAIKMSEEYK